jgi:hypothetical protein
MKKIFILPILLLIASYGFAQTDAPDHAKKTGCLTDPDMPRNAVPAWPKSAYTPVEDASCAPCYEYTSKRGTVIMECPFLIFPSQASSMLPGTSAVATEHDVNGNVNVQEQHTYTGNYPACSKKLYPPHSTPVWPKTAYTPTGNPDCAPCYEYTSKKGTVIMECPYLIFPSEFPPEKGN